MLVTIRAIRAGLRAYSTGPARATVKTPRRTPAPHLLTAALALGLSVLGWAWLRAQNPTVGSPAPVVPQTFLDSAGRPLATGTISTYVTGTSTSAVTYSDPELNTRQVNPIALNAAGRAAIFLSATQVYRFVVADSANAIQYTQDGIRPVGYTATQVAQDLACHVRLTLATGVPVTTAGFPDATTVYATPYQGDTCALYDGTAWNRYAFTELSQSLGTDAANTNYDLFMVASGGQATLVRVAWTNDLDRAFPLAVQQGILVQSGTPTRRYLGTYRTTNVIGRTEDTVERRYVFSYYNRVPRLTQIFENTNSWTYSTNNYRISNNSTRNVLSFVTGDTVLVQATAQSHLSNNAVGGSIAYLAIGDGTSSRPIQGSYVSAQATTAESRLFRATANQYARVGFHTWTWLERAGTAGTTTWLGDDGNNNNELTQSGIWGWLEM